MTQDVFVDSSKEIVEYLHIKNPQFCYCCIDPDFLALKRNSYKKEVVSIELKGCMKQHLVVFEPNSTNIMCREYLCKCSQCLQLNFGHCVDSNELHEKECNQIDGERYDEAEIDSYGDHIFNFAYVPSYVTLVSGRSTEPLYFVFVKEKRLADKMLRDCFDHIIKVGEQFFRGYYLKLVRSQNSTAKQFELIERELLIPSDEINDTNVDINDSLQININVYNALINKGRL